MKKLFLLPVLFFLSLYSFAQAPYIQWQKCYGGSQLDEGRYIMQTTDSGYIVTGVTGSNDSQVSGNKGPYDTWVVKLNSAGAIMWQKCYGGSKSDNSNYIQQTADGGYIFIASSKSNDSDLTLNHGKFDIWVVKLTSTGAIAWQKTFGGSEVDAVHCVKQTADGGYVVAGRTASTDGDITSNHGDYDAWILRLSASGSLIWQKTYGGTGGEDAGCAIESRDGGFIIAGTTNSNDGDVSGNHGGDDYWVIKTDNTGTIIWQKCFGGTGDDAIIDESGGSAGIVENPDSSIVLAGWSDSNDGDVTGVHGGTDYWIVKITRTGSIVWQKAFGGTSDDDATSIFGTPDGGYVINGVTNSNDGDVSGKHGQGDYWVIKISGTGALQWQKCLGGNGTSPGDFGMAVQPTMGGGYIAAGLTSANDGDVSGNHGDYDYWVVKLNCAMPEVGPITGPSNVCVGATITLSDTAAAGSWNNSTGKASVVAAGVITGITAGTDVISYSVVNTCGADIATYTITINPLPVPVISATGAVLSTTASFTSYQWLSGSTVIPGATGATYTAPVSGTYRVVVTDANGCSDTSAAQNIVPAKIINAGNISAITVSPNPANRSITVNGEQIATIKLYNSVGQLVKESATNSIIISGLPDGFYIVEAIDCNGMVIGKQKITKN